MLGYAGYWLVIDGSNRSVEGFASLGTIEAAFCEDPALAMKALRA